MRQMDELGKCQRRNRSAIGEGILGHSSRIERAAGEIPVGQGLVEASELTECRMKATERPVHELISNAKSRRDWPVRGQMDRGLMIRGNAAQFKRIWTAPRPKGCALKGQTTRKGRTQSFRAS